MITNLDVFKNKKVRQSNVLVEATYAQEFTAMELKVFEINLASFYQEDMELYFKEIDKKISFSRSELATLLDMDPSIISREAHRISSSLMKKYIEIKNILDEDSIEFKQIGIVPFCEYNKGIFTIHWNYRLIPFLLEIKNNFTEFSLHYILSLNSAYAMKLYKLLYQYKNIKSRKFKIEELKEQFGLLNKYDHYKDFRKRIIEPSVAQINKNTDLNVVFKEFKIGRKVEKLEFNFDLKGATNLKVNSSEIKTISKFAPINENGNSNEVFSKKTGGLISEYKKLKGSKYVEICIDYAKRNSKSNFDKYLADTLLKGWADQDMIKYESKKKNELCIIEKTKLIDIEKKQIKEKEHLAKSEIEHQWNKTLDLEKQKFIDYSNFIIKKYKYELNSFVNCEEKLPLSIFAVTKGTYYNRNIESYIKNIIKISLNINDFLVK